MARFTMTNAGVTMNGKKLPAPAATDLKAAPTPPPRPKSRFTMTNAGVSEGGLLKPLPVPQQTELPAEQNYMRTSDRRMAMSPPRRRRRRRPVNLTDTTEAT